MTVSARGTAFGAKRLGNLDRPESPSFDARRDIRSIAAQSDKAQASIRGRDFPTVASCRRSLGKLPGGSRGSRIRRWAHSGGTIRSELY